MVGDDRQERIDSGPRDAAAGLAYAILFIAWQVGAVYLSARWLMGALWAGLLVCVGPMFLVLWAWRDAVSQPSRDRGRPVQRLGPSAKVGCATALAFIFWFISAVAVGATQKEVLSARKAACVAHIKDLTLATLTYANDHGGRLPDATSWADGIAPYLDSAAGAFQCPSAVNKDFSYAYNESLSGKNVNEVKEPAGVVLVFESDLGRNAAGDQQLLPIEPRHIGGDDYGLADGHAMWVMRRVRSTDEHGYRVYEKAPVSRNLTWPLHWRP